MLPLLRVAIVIIAATISATSEGKAGTATITVSAVPVATVTVAPTTLPLVVYSMVRKSVEPRINAISTLMLVGTTVLVWAADRLARGSARA